MERIEKSMLQKIWKKITGQERLYKTERELLKKMMECSEKDEEWKKLNRKRKEIRRTRFRRQRQCGIMLLICLALLILLFLWLVTPIVIKAMGNGITYIKHAFQTEAPLQTETETETETESEIEPTELLLTFTGDCILGTDEFFAWDTGLPAYYDMYGPEYFLENVRDIFEKDDITIINMEGTLTEETTRVQKQFAFKGDPEYVKILTSSSVEAANVANNHTSDYGEKSFRDTVEILEKNGIQTFGYDEVTMLEIRGIKVGIFGVYELDDHMERVPQVKNNIAKLKEQGADLIVAVFHWSNELVTVPDENQVTLAHLAIDEGADVVVGHHPHVVQGIDEYRGKTIAYSLGNFCFGGNTHPTEMDTFIFQQKFQFNSKKEITGTEYNVIPCLVSSEEYINNYQPTPLTGEAAEITMEKIRERTEAIHSNTESSGIE